mmetsp:Transcript_30150/g.40040  ORF Transcript_30150/g.40040 Transcript_30150/m.40040 type:complete len:288 (-) Transcript_30150:760-1623(-)
MHVVLKGGKEARKILLAQTALFDLLTARISDHSLHLLDIDVAVFINIDLVSKVRLKGSLGLKLILQKSVHFDQVLLNLLKFIGGHMLAIENEHVVIKNVALDEAAKVAAPARSDAVGRARDHTLICLHIVVEATQVSRHITVLDFAALLILEHEEVLVQVLPIVLHLRRGLQTTLKDSHELLRVSLVGAFLIQAETVLTDVAQVILEDLAPLVPLAQLLKRLWCQSGQIECLVTFVVFEGLHEVKFFKFIGRRDFHQVGREVLISIEEQIGELLQGKVGIGVHLSGH